MRDFTLCTVLFLIMFALKLGGPLAAVSWWWITLPLWGPALIVVPLYAFIGYKMYQSYKAWR